MDDFYLDQAGHALGSVQRDLGEADRAGDLVSSSEALRDAGFERHHICAPQETAYDLACRALQASEIDTAGIDCLIYATCLPCNGNLPTSRDFKHSRDVKDLMHFPASRLQAQFDMDDAFVIGLNQQACTGMLGSIRIARNMLLAEPELEQVLCISADRFPPGALYEQAYNLISDGAAACRVSRNAQGFRIRGARQISNGAMVTANDDETVGSYFNYCHRIIGETLAESGLRLSDIRWVVPQNTNHKAWQVLASLLQIDAERAWFSSMADCGHVISADNIINLSQLEASGRLASGDLLLTFMAGFGSHWQCLILEKV